MRVAAIDIGTNTVLLLVADTATGPLGGALRPVLERATITRLGEGVDRSRRLLDSACERTLTCLESYASEVREHCVTHVAAVGTSALRDAQGGHAFLERVACILGVAPRVIDGAEEARLTFNGALSGLRQRGQVCVFDIGGGSTEIVLGARGETETHISAAVSLNIGSVRLYERHVRRDPPDGGALQRVEADIAHAMASAPKFAHGSTLVGVAGTVTQLAALELGLPADDGARVHGSTLTRCSVERLTLHLASLTLAERRALPGMAPGRADVLVVGGAIARAVLQWSGAADFVVSDRGVRWGLAEELAQLGGAAG